MHCLYIWALPERGGLNKGLPGWFGALFFHVCPFDRRGGRSKEPTHFKKELPISSVSLLLVLTPFMAKRSIPPVIKKLKSKAGTASAKSWGHPTVHSEDIKPSAEVPD